MGLHITREDGAYPKNEQGIALATGRVSKVVKPYRHLEEGWKQVSGGDGGGVLVILPEEAAKFVIEAREEALPKNILFRDLWVLFDVVDGDPRMRGEKPDADLQIPIRGRTTKRHPLDEGE